MKQIITFIIACISAFSVAQEKDKAELLALKKSNNYVYEGNSLAQEEDVVSAEMAYRKAISERPSSVTGTYNLGNTYYKSGNYEEALYRHKQAVESATSKAEKHKAFHNIGNTFMKGEKYKEAVEAYKNALRNDPTDEETRYNLAVAKKKQKEQEDKQQDDKQDDNKDKNDKDKENKDNKEDKDNKEGDKKEDNKDKKDEDQDKKEGDDKKDEEGKPKDEKEDKGKPDEDKKEEQKPKPQPGQLSPQQIKNLLEAMNNQEQKVQEKMNEEKQKGVKIKTDKDW